MVSEKRKYPIVVPDTLMPLRDPSLSEEELCACKKTPVDLREEIGIFHWEVEIGDQLEKGDTIGEGEVGKRIIEIISPVNGKLVAQCIEECEVFKANDILGYIDAE